MSGALISVTAPDMSRVARALSDAGAELTDWRTAWRVVAPLIGPQTAASLRSGGRLVGQGWPELSARYARRKAAAGGGRIPGVLTGETERDVASGQVTITKSRLGYAPNGRVAFYLHHGRPGRQPAREFMGITPALERVMVEAAGGRADEVMSRTADAIEGAR